MCPQEPHPIGLDVSDEQVILFLEGFKTGTLLPNNVLDDINPFKVQPSNLPDGIWYVMHSNINKENDFGFWKVKEDASEVFSNSSISGWRRTLEFFEFVDYPERRTAWLMQEYSITQKGQHGTNKEKESRAMCRIFHSPTATRANNKEDHSKSMAAANEAMNESTPILPITPSSNDSNFGKVSSSGSLIKTTTVDGKSDDKKLLDPQQRYTFDPQDMFDGDYLELDDLVDPLSYSSSSVNSHRSSMTYDEGFDPTSLIWELEDSSNSKGRQENDSSSRCVFTASVSPFEVVMPPATTRPLVCDIAKHGPSGCKQETSPIIQTKYHDVRLGAHSIKRPKIDQRDKDPLSSRGADASSSASIKPAPIEKKDKEAAAAAVGVNSSKRLKKYFCFLPF